MHSGVIGGSGATLPKKHTIRFVTSLERGQDGLAMVGCLVGFYGPRNR